MCISTREYLQKRLESDDLLPAARAVLQSALDSQAKEVAPGFFVGDRIRYLSIEGVVIADEESEVPENIARWRNRHHRDPARHGFCYRRGVRRGRSTTGFLQVPDPDIKNLDR